MNEKKAKRKGKKKTTKKCEWRGEKKRVKHDG